MDVKDVKYELSVITIDIPLVGRCTLMPCCYEFLPHGMRTYTGIAKLAKALILTELPELGQTQVQEIFRSISIFLSEGKIKSGAEVCIILSGKRNPQTESGVLHSCLATTLIAVVPGHPRLGYAHNLV